MGPIRANHRETWFSGNCSRVEHFPPARPRWDPKGYPTALPSRRTDDFVASSAGMPYYMSGQGKHPEARDSGPEKRVGTGRTL
jgi:hypothetical protein